MKKGRKFSKLYAIMALLTFGVIGFVLTDYSKNIDKKNRINSGSIWLKEIVTNDIPEITNATNDWQRVNLLREWGHSNIDWSSRKALLDQDKSFNFYDKSAVDIFSAFFQDKGGVMCGGTAYSLKKLYQLFGFKAYAYDMGKPGVMTHVVTLVEIKFQNSVKLVVQDATFDITYADNQGEPLDYFDLLSLLSSHKHEAINIIYGKSENGDFLLHPDDKSQYSQIISLKDSPFVVLESGLLKFRSRLTLSSFDRSFGKAIKEFLVKEGHPPDNIYLFLYPIGGDQTVIDKVKEGMTVKK